MKSFTKQRINEATNLALAYGVRVTHIRPNFLNKGGLTVAYRTEFKHAKTIEIALSNCSDKDQFDRAIGRTLAVERFLAEKTITIPYNEHVFGNPVTQLRKLFEYQK